MIIFAALGFFLQKLNFSMGAIVLGMILGPIANTNGTQKPY
jgi:TctA family transporter